MAWRLARALDVLRQQVNAAWPDRNKQLDGTIGDLRHQRQGASDHNPNPAGVVCAIDITHDPNGPDGDRLAADAIAELKPATVRVVTLLDKPEARQVDVPLDYVGFRIPNLFVLGYGLDYGQLARNLPDLYVLADSPVHGHTG